MTERSPQRPMTRRQRRRVAHQLNNQPKARPDTIVADGSEPVLTNGERRVVQLAASACRGIEQAFNTAVGALLGVLAVLKAQLVAARTKYRELIAAYGVRVSELGAIDDAIKARGEHLHRQRRMSKRVRLGLLVGLSLLDVTAYRSAAEVVFATSDDLSGKIESFLLSLLSIGMIVAASVAGGRFRHWLDAKADEEAADNDPLVVRAARRELILGIVLAALTVIALWAGAMLRLRSMEIDGNPVSPLVMVATVVFSALAALGAFVIELVWANEMLDKRDRLVAAVRSADKKADRQADVCTHFEGQYRANLAKVTTLWGQYEPHWNTQVNECLAMIYHARKIQPGRFGALAASIDDLVCAILKSLEPTVPALVPPQ